MDKVLYKFFKRGMTAREEGIMCAPMMDPEVMKMLKEFDAPIVPAMKEWQLGWTLENLNGM